jgi:hypothetical protein
VCSRGQGADPYLRLDEHQHARHGQELREPEAA